MIAVWFALAATAGAVIRHGVNLLGRAWVGTLVLNVVGAFVVGALTGSGASADTLLVIGTAGCGSLTTFSTFALEVVEARDTTRVWIVAATVAGTILAAATGYWLA